MLEERHKAYAVRHVLQINELPLSALHSASSVDMGIHEQCAQSLHSSHRMHSVPTLHSERQIPHGYRRFCVRALPVAILPRHIKIKRGPHQPYVNLQLSIDYEFTFNPCHSPLTYIV